MLSCLCGLKYSLKNWRIPQTISNVLKAISPLIKEEVIKEVGFWILFQELILTFILIHEGCNETIQYTKLCLTHELLPLYKALIKPVLKGFVWFLVRKYVGEVKGVQKKGPVLTKIQKTDGLKYKTDWNAKVV